MGAMVAGESVQLARVMRALRALSAGNQALVRATSEQQLLQDICDIAVDHCGYRMAWVGVARNVADRCVDVLAYAGEDAGYLESAAITWADEPMGRGPTGLALRTGKPQVCRNFLTDPRVEPWREEALARGYQSSLVVPFRFGDDELGALNVYATEPDAFDDEVTRLLTGLAADLAFGIGALRTRIRHLEAEQSWVSSERLLRQLIKHTPAAVAMLDNDLRYIDASDRWREDYNLGDQPLIGRSHYEVFPEIPERWRQVHQRVLAGAIEKCDEDAFQREDGTTEWLQWEVRPWYRGDGSIGGVVMYTQVITERKRVEQALKQSEERIRQVQKMEAIGQLAGGIAHDFNNLIAAIMIHAELAATDDDPVSMRESLGTIIDAAKRAAALTRQVLQFSRQEVMQLRPINLNDSVQGISAMLQRVLREDVTLRTELSTPAPWTHADTVMLDQVLMNLCVNACDAMGAGGQLTITTAVVDVDASEARRFADLPPGRYVRLQVRDTGSGIAPEHMARVFEPFFTTKQPGKGTGLGLATVFGIVQQHRGGVAVSSTLNVGTTVEVLLPAYDDTAATTLSTEPPPPAVRGSETILVVEDDDAVRGSLTSTLVRNGYRVLTATNGPEALAQFSEHVEQIVLVLTDMVMPGGMTGRELSAELRRRKPDLKVILSSGYSPDFYGPPVILSANERYLHKPATTRQLLGTVRDALDRS